MPRATVIVPIHQDMLTDADLTEAQVEAMIAVEATKTLRDLGLLHGLNDLTELERHVMQGEELAHFVPYPDPSLLYYRFTATLS